MSRFIILLSFAFSFLVLPSAFAQQIDAIKDADPSGQVYVDFMIGDRSPPGRKWGHVSLRVVSPGVDKTFDFGRYRKMWGLKDASEGEPILRVWKAGTMEKYRAYHHKDGGTTKIYHFASNTERNRRILAFFDRMTNGAEVVSNGATMTIYNSKYKTFHAVDVNCTTVAVDAFMEGFPYNLKSMRYATARSLEWYMRGEAKKHNYDDARGVWNRIWWPPDLTALLDEQYVRQGLATVSIL